MKNIKALLSDFNARQRMLTIFMASAIIFMIFFWTNTIINAQTEKLNTRINDTYERIESARRNAVIIDYRRRNTQKLSTGLFTYIQGLSGKLRLRVAITGTRLVSSQSNQEQVSFRTENLVYEEFVGILKDFEQYDNIQVKNLSIRKRFDNPRHIDANWDIIRSY